MFFAQGNPYPLGKAPRLGSKAERAPSDAGTTHASALPTLARARPARTRPALRERVSVRSSPTRRAAHLAPQRPRWRGAASYFSESASSRIPSSPASPWRASGLEAVAAAAIVRGTRLRSRQQADPAAARPRGGGRGERAQRGGRAPAQAAAAVAAVAAVAAATVTGSPGPGDRVPRLPPGPARRRCAAGAAGSSCCRRALRLPGQPERKGEERRVREAGG